jgi:uncharacterized protein (DUF433 family)
MRLRRSIRQGLELWAARGGRSVSEVAQELIEEGIRMRECPGIYFASEPGGRVAKVSGTGLAVWEVLRGIRRGASVERLRRSFPHLSRLQIAAALVYGARFGDEIRRQAEANASFTGGALAKQYPSLVQVVRTR